MTTSILRALASASAAALLIGCASAEHHEQAPDSLTVTGTQGTPLTATPLETFDSAWAMTFLPDGRALVSEKDGNLWLLGTDGKKLGEITNVPSVKAMGQGGLGDIILHPEFAENGTVFLSYVERDPADDSLSGAAVERATLRLTEQGGVLENREVIWRQSPKVTGNGHYGHRLAVGPEGHLFIASGERQKFTPAQNMATNLGKVVRINQDGSIPEDNPFHGNGAVTDQVWTLGHRNPLGIAFDAQERLWVVEMGPKGGDELNLIVRSENYGYPEVSEGDHYSGKPIPTHESNPVFEDPAIAWIPAISPAGLVFYSGDVFEEWQGHAFIGGLSSQALIRVSFETQPTDNLGQPPKDGQTEPVATEAERYEWGKRIREVEQGPDGALYVLEDKEGGRLIRLTPASN
ncbi:PQQ-dependent sugar dehydrogenase [Hyphomonas sp.]|uniref:PQQ-dependent sugar dehydrogenase n=1 Tax=Hyphomonas sp. TaxID=87 RepID=UPI0025BD1519|nr:PQQ-dependent sugar dehydrogenase [Hyphomonas sp.]